MLESMASQFRFALSLLTSTLRTRLSLQLEIAALCHQLSLYQSKGRRPRIAPADRLLWSVLAKLWSGWRKACFFVQPRTVTIWQKRRFREFWRALASQVDARYLESYESSSGGCGRRIPLGAHPVLWQSCGSSGSMSQNQPWRSTSLVRIDRALRHGRRFSTSM